MFNQKYIILFIDRARIQLYGGGISGIVTIDIPDVIISDIDVLEKEELYTFIKKCVKQYMMRGAQLIIVLSQATCFEKLFDLPDTSQTESEIFKFFDSVPYESIWTKVYLTQKGKRAVAVNKELYEVFHQGFMLQGIPTKAIIPACVLGQVGVKHALDKQMADYIFGNVESLVKQSILDTHQTGTPASPAKEIEPKNTQKSNVLLLVSAFGALVLVLVVVLVIQMG
jgi:hypothetical protein